MFNNCDKSKNDDKLAITIWNHKGELISNDIIDAKMTPSQIDNIALIIKCGYTAYIASPCKDKNNE